MSPTFKVTELFLVDVGEDSMLNPFDKKGNDENHRGQANKDPLHVFDGPMSRSLVVKKINEIM